MNPKKEMEYDHKSSISFVGILMTVCSLLAGFSFTGTTIVLTRISDPSSAISQIVLLTLIIAIGFFIFALWELQYMNTLTSIQSSNPIVPKYPERWRVINLSIWLGSFLLMISIAVMLLLRNLVILFLISLSFWLVSNIFNYFYRWKPVEKKLKEYLEES